MTFLPAFIPLLYFPIGVFAIFTIATILYQVKFFQPKFNKFNKYHIFPNYSFFAPNPLVNDYRLVYKIITDANKDWVEIPIHEKFKLRRMFWNPSKYYNKAMIDTCHQLLAEFHAYENKNYIQISLNYLSILVFISSFLKQDPHYKQHDTLIRFAIISSEGAEAIESHKIVFLSYNQRI